MLSTSNGATPWTFFALLGMEFCVRMRPVMGGAWRVEQEEAVVGLGLVSQGKRKGARTRTATAAILPRSPKRPPPPVHYCMATPLPSPAPFPFTRIA